METISHRLEATFINRDRIDWVLVVPRFCVNNLEINFIPSENIDLLRNDFTENRISHSDFIDIRITIAKSVTV